MLSQMQLQSDGLSTYPNELAIPETVPAFSAVVVDTRFLSARVKAVALPLRSVIVNGHANHGNKLDGQLLN
jgi:hypothetical protein